MLRSLPTTIIALAIAAPAVAAQELRLDHKAGVWTYVSGGNSPNTQTVSGGETIRLDTHDLLRVRVVNSNNALYTCTLEQPEAKVPELEALRSALGTFGPYLTNVATLSLRDWLGANIKRDALIAPNGILPAPPPPPPSEAERAREAARSALAEVDAFLFGPRGLNAARLSLLTALDGLRTAEGKGIQNLTDRLESDACAGADCGSQTLAQTMMDLLNRAATAHRNLRPHLPRLQGTDAATLNEVLGKLQGDTEALMATAYRTEYLIRLVANAQPEIDCGSVTVRRESGRSLSIAVAARALAETERVATLPARRLKVEAQPRLRPRPAIGVALVYAPKAQYQVPGTQSQVGGGVQIASTSMQDARFTYGVTLSMILTDRVGPVQLPFTFGPEIVANPSSDTRAVGLGVGGTIFGGFKWGSGILWTRHRVLDDGQNYGDALPFADRLRTRETYGKGQIYVSASLTGWPLIKL